MGQLDEAWWGPCRKFDDPNGKNISKQSIWRFPGSSMWPFWDGEVTPQNVKWPPTTESKGVDDDFVRIVGCCWWRWGQSPNMLVPNICHCSCQSSCCRNGFMSRYTRSHDSEWVYSIIKYLCLYTTLGCKFEINWQGCLRSNMESFVLLRPMR